MLAGRVQPLLGLGPAQGAADRFLSLPPGYYVHVQGKPFIWPEAGQASRAPSVVRCENRRCPVTWGRCE